MLTIDVRFGPKFGIFHQCSSLLVREHAVTGWGIQYHSILCMFHGFDSWLSSSGTILVILPLIILQVFNT
jgi:hypothetical protein